MASSQSSIFSAVLFPFFYSSSFVSFTSSSPFFPSTQVYVMPIFDLFLFILSPLVIFSTLFTFVLVIPKSVSPAFSWVPAEPSATWMSPPYLKPANLPSFSGQLGSKCNYSSLAPLISYPSTKSYQVYFCNTLLSHESFLTHFLRPNNSSVHNLITSYLETVYLICTSVKFPSTITVFKHQMGLVRIYSNPHLNKHTFNNISRWSRNLCAVNSSEEPTQQS